jgi:integrase/recombinase XerD
MILSESDVKQLLATPYQPNAVGVRDAAMIQVLASSGCRATELAGLRLNAVNLARQLLKVHGKGRKERLIPIDRAARSILAKYLERARPRLARGHADSPMVFLARGGGHITRQTVWEAVKRRAEAAGLSQPISPHTLRHSLATRLLAGGMDLRAVQEILGHSQIKTTQIYTRVDLSALKAVHAKFHPRNTP